MDNNGKVAFTTFPLLPSLRKIKQRPCSPSDCNTDDKCRRISDNLDSSDENRKHIEYFRQSHCPASDKYSGQKSKQRQCHCLKRNRPFKKKNQISQNSAQSRTILIEQNMVCGVCAVSKILYNSNLYNQRKKSCRHDHASTKTDDCQKDLFYPHQTLPPFSMRFQSMQSEFHFHRYASVPPEVSGQP